MKSVKLSLSSTNEDLLATMIDEGKRVEYWHKKHYGGPRKYDAWQDEQLAKVQTLPAGSEIVGDMIDYHSLATGNRWKTFEVTTCYGVGNAYTRMFRFCYWDTYGSVGAFYKCVSGDRKHHAVLVFPSHFFLRYADRMGIQHRDAALVSEFFNRNHGFAIRMSEDADENGRRQFIIGTKEGAGYGFSRTNIDTEEDLYNNDNVLEVRTFLTYEQMNKRQREECEKVRKMAEDVRLLDDAPAIHTIGRMMEDKAFADEFQKRTASRLNLTPELFTEAQYFFYGIINIADFVSSDMRKSIAAFAEGKVNDDAQESGYRLMDIIASHMREDPAYHKKDTWHKALLITREWKGDDYDWNKWFWSLLSKLQARCATDEEKAKYEPWKAKCIREEFTFEKIEQVIINTFRERNQ